MSGAGSLWLMRAESGLSAHFKQPDGSSRPGTDWRIRLTRGAQTHTVLVRTYLADGLSPRLAADQDFIARGAMAYLNDLLNQGWHPGEPRELVVVVDNPPERPTRRKKPFWKFWQRIGAVDRGR